MERDKDGFQEVANDPSGEPGDDEQTRQRLGWSVSRPINFASNIYDARVGKKTLFARKYKNLNMKTNKNHKPVDIFLIPRENRTEAAF